MQLVMSEFPQRLYIIKLIKDGNATEEKKNNIKVNSSNENGLFVICNNTKKSNQ